MSISITILIIKSCDFMHKKAARHCRTANCYILMIKTGIGGLFGRLAYSEIITRHLYILRLNTELLKCDRREFFDALRAENIGTQVHYIPVYWHSYYEKLGYKKGICPEAEKLYSEILSIPLFYSMTDEDVEDVIRAVEKIVEYFRR